LVEESRARMDRKIGAWKVSQKTHPIIGVGGILPPGGERKCVLISVNIHILLGLDVLLSKGHDACLSFSNGHFRSMSFSCPFS